VFLGGESGPDEVAVAIIGSGFSGLGMAIRLKQAGTDDFAVLERAGDVGGTWRDNTYPGCQCDVQSHLYSFSFAPNPDWSRAFSEQPEIWEYLRRCADDYGITGHIRFGHEVCSATWDEDAGRWRIETSRGALSARVLVAAVGPLSEPALPAIPGLETFQGTRFHSANWDHPHDLSGERVAVIGTGASAIQFVPRIQPQVERLHVFQRTPPWVMPHADRPLGGLERRLYRMLPPLQRLARWAIYWRREALVLAFRDHRRMGVAERMARRHLESQIEDPELRRRLTPSYTIGCKRILLSNDYYPALAQPNVELVTEDIREVRPSSIVTADGVEREVDTIIFGTGFHVTDMPAARYIRGRGGQLMDDLWQGSPRAYLGTTVAGFPNLFMLAGPNTGLGHSSLVIMIEAQLAYVMGCLRYMQDRAFSTVEVLPEAEAAFNERVEQAGRGTVWTAGGCKSWYLDRTGRNSAIWPDFTWKFRRLTRRFNPADYALM
jgi:cation diffusion facilitator CzcD-associated flavoprotein CzcO